MAGGKETPRQKMIGMMYLVLTALLALNVSKEIIAAFVTINDKLDSSGEIVKQTTGSIFEEFQSKRLGIQQQGGDMKAFDLWHGKAKDAQLKTYKTVDFILGESNEMIKQAEGGKDWVKDHHEVDDEKYIKELRSLFDINAMDNYDIPTNMFIGGNPQKPKERGLALRDSILSYRDYVTKKMGNYELGSKSYTFEPPADTSGLEEALQSANPDDRESIRRVFTALSVPELIEVKDAGQTKEIPWPSAMFDHAPIVAAAAMLTALKVDVLSAESQVTDFFLSKIDAPSFNFNKIEPLAFAKSSYINSGDSIGLKVMVAAYDSTKDMKLQYWKDDSLESPENMQEFEGETGEMLTIVGQSPGDHIITGKTAVEVKGKEELIPWDFRYTVGEPSGTVSLPEMNVLYRGYDNKVEGAASGFPDYQLSPGSNISALSRSGEFYSAKPGSAREASINISGVAADGSSANLGTFEFRVQDLPKPSVSLGRISDGESATSGQLRASRRLFAGYPPSIPLKAEFSIVGWELTVSGAPRPAEGRGANLTGDAQRMISGAGSGDMITIVTEYREPSGRVKRQNAVFKVK
ncbi:MAG: hypothetical protein ACQERC_05425 [Bacteroidota bacterium]